MAGGSAEIRRQQPDYRSNRASARVKVTLLSRVTALHKALSKTGKEQRPLQDLGEAVSCAASLISSSSQGELRTQVETPFDKSGKPAGQARRAGMRTLTRRTVMKGGLAVAGALAAPRGTLGQAGNRKIINAVMHGDIPSYDPVWSSADMSQYHGAMVYDTLFGVDAGENPHPQMVGKYGLSDDKLTWTFELRDGLRFHDGTSVTSADVVPSIRRWAARNGFGQHMMSYVKDISAKDEKTFTIQLKERYGLVLDVLGSLCFIMRKKEAEIDPMQKIESVIGSGPFKFNVNETRPGTQYVYDKNLDYVPRKEAPSGIAGGKIVKVDRVVYINMPDPQTAVAAVQAGEIDFYETPPIDFLDLLSQDKSVKVQVLNESGNIGIIRLNFLHPPFDNERCRQAMLHIVRQADYVAAIASPKYSRTCASLFACGTPMENDANTGWFKTAPDYTKAKQLLKEGGYDGRPVLLMQATNIAYMKTAAEILASEMRQAGINVQMEPMDWSNVATRRAVKAPPDHGGWDIFITSAVSAIVGNPIKFIGHPSNGEKGWFGWPSDAKNEELRARWALAEKLDERKKIAREMQDNAWNYVPQVWFGQWVQPAVMRANINGILPIAGVVPWWNVEKV
ncbi:peptide/nickel transport system substrate-binding protein [Bradyrhizobium sp. i1.15.2]|uniref:ABC transporter substrate-binding protein n=1 Tax=Bradyrhizobium sp. i1.15.2 TaxID=3156362 RepID=UPI0033990F7F